MAAVRTTDATAKVVIYEAFVEGKLETPKHLARTVHDLYFEPKYEESRPRTIWSLSNALTSAFKELEAIPQFKATAKLGGFLESRFSQCFYPERRYRPDRRSSGSLKPLIHPRKAPRTVPHMPEIDIAGYLPSAFARPYDEGMLLCAR